MLSVNLIQRHFQGGRLDALMDALAANGLDLPLPLRIRLSEITVSAVAMGLRRVVELTYGPTGLSREMTRFLLDAQEVDGSFGHDPLATAAAAAALGKLLTEHRAAAEPDVLLARERALAALVAMQNDEGLFHAPQHGNDRTQQERALTSAFVLYLLSRDDEFRHTVRLADLLNWFELHHDQLESDTHRLWTMATVNASKSKHGPDSPAVNAIAA